jgi:hypothetical protein
MFGEIYRPSSRQIDGRGMTLPAPEQCATCRRATRLRIIDSRLRKQGYRRRVLECLHCGNTWAVYESRVHPIEALEAITDWSIRRGLLTYGNARSH